MKKKGTASHIISTLKNELIRAQKQARKAANTSTPTSGDDGAVV